MGKFQIYQDGRAAGANPISGSDFVTKDYLENHSVELDPVYKADSGSLKASASLASASNAWITLNSGSLTVSMSYDSDQKKIRLFSSGSTVVAEIDATDFIKDGMVNTITLDTGSLDLTITFNTDAGKEDIVVPMRNVFDLTMFYTKDETYNRDEIATLSQPFVSASNWVAENSASLMSGSVVVLPVDSSTYDESTETWQVGSEFVSRVSTLLGEGKTVILKISTMDGVIYPRFITTIAGVAHVFGGFVSPDLGSTEGEPFTNHIWLLQLGTGTLAYIAHRLGGYHPEPLTWVEGYSGSLSELAGWFDQSGSSAAQVVSWVTNNSASIVTGSIENVPDVVVLPVDNSTWDGESNVWNVGTEFVSEVSAAVADNKAVYLAISDTDTTLYPPLVAAAPGYMYGFGGLTMPGSNYSEHRTWILMSNGYLQQNITQGQNYIEGLEQWVTDYSASLIEAEHWITDSGSLTVTASAWVAENSSSVESTVDWVAANSASISASAISSSLWKKGGRNSAGSPVASIVAGWTTPDNALDTGIYTINAGWGSHTSGNYAVAFNAFTSASGQHSFAEGFGTKARGDKSHAEGDQTTAHAAGSHTEGGATVASGGYSHAEGWRTNTTNPYEHAQGKFNATHSNQIFSVGVGYGDPGLVGEYYGKNAISVITGSTPTASIYILGVGSYDGTNPEPGVNDIATVISNISGSGGISTETDPVYITDSASLKASASVATEASASVAAISAKTGSYDALISLPAVTAADNGKILRVVNGAWALVDPVTVYSGQGAPDSTLGQDGDIYLQS